MKKTVNTHFVSKACSLCSLKIGTPMRMKFWFKTILYIINCRIEIVGILLARVYAASEKLSGCYTKILICEASLQNGPYVAEIKNA